MHAFEAGQPLKQAVLDNAEIMAQLSVAEVEALFDYRQQLGLCPQFVERVVSLTQRDRDKDAPFLEFG
jgi:hypothetical protein